MIRIFDRYFSLRNTVYFCFENVMLFSCLVWGLSSHFGMWNIVLALLICQACLYYNELQPAFPRFSIKAFWVKYLQAIVWMAALLFGVYLAFYFPSKMPGLPWIRLAIFPFMVIGLRLGYQVLTTSEMFSAPILIIGSGSVMTQLRGVASKQNVPGFRMIYIQWDLHSGDAEAARLKEMVKKNGIKKVVLAFQNRRGRVPVDFLLKLRVEGVEIFEHVSFYEQITGKIWVESLKPSNLIFCSGFNRLTIARFGKRMIDILAALFCLIIFSPFFLILPILIKLSSEGSVFYSQERVGEKCHSFTMLKFRSMSQDAEAETGPVWAVKNDPRVTKVGKMMRILRLDELPQLMNVLKGEMSFVGPRPERPVFVETLENKIPFYRLRHTVKPGLTGWAQVKYRYGSSDEDALEKLQYDLYYVKHRSLVFDITIAFETIRVVLMGTGAR